MASAWGQSWGSAWGVSWGGEAATTRPAEGHHPHRQRTERQRRDEAALVALLGVVLPLISGDNGAREERQP